MVRKHLPNPTSPGVFEEREIRERQKKRKKDLFEVGRMNVSLMKSEERILKLRGKECSV